MDSYSTGVKPVRDTIIYARVSSRAQQNDLNRQVAAITQLYPDAEVISEIGEDEEIIAEYHLVLVCKKDNPLKQKG